MHTVTTQAKSIPAALFDELKKRADAKGGVGYYWAHEGSAEFPRCILDFAAEIDGRPSLAAANVYGISSPALSVLSAAIGDAAGTQNDDAVEAINKRKGVVRWGLERRTMLPRVTFDELAAELGLVRAEA